VGTDTQIRCCILVRETTFDTPHAMHHSCPPARSKPAFARLKPSRKSRVYLRYESPQRQASGEIDAGPSRTSLLGKSRVGRLAKFPARVASSTNSAKTWTAGGDVDARTPACVVSSKKSIKTDCRRGRRALFTPRTPRNPACTFIGKLGKHRRPRTCPETPRVGRLKELPRYGEQ
jgi:hypothetical protein